MNYEYSKKKKLFLEWCGHFVLHIGGKFLVLFLKFIYIVGIKSLKTKIDAQVLAWKLIRVMA